MVSVFSLRADLTVRYKQTPEIIFVLIVLVRTWNSGKTLEASSSGDQESHVCINLISCRGCILNRTADYGR